ncbi:hypothetical protein T484DRAFT_1783687 [Baffinella frigidus]|nr:hypothetical protein T484DRAFT_1783687 [Cryptophyta sp. CCMP2293]
MACALQPVLYGFLSMVPSAILFDRLKAKHPPENILKQRFLRLVVDGIEKGGGGEFDDDLMDIITESMAEGAGKELVPFHYRTFFLADGSDVSLQLQSGFGAAATGDVSLKLRSGFGAAATGGTGSTLWGAGFFLFDLIARLPHVYLLHLSTQHHCA